MNRLIFTTTFFLFLFHPTWAEDTSPPFAETFLHVCGQLPNSAEQVDAAAKSFGFLSSEANVAQSTKDAPFPIYRWHIGEDPNGPTIEFMTFRGKGNRVCGLSLTGESIGVLELLKSQLKLGTPSSDLSGKLGKGFVWEVSGTAGKSSYTWSQTGLGGKIYSGIKVIYEVPNQ